MQAQEQALAASLRAAREATAHGIQNAVENAVENGTRLRGTGQEPGNSELPRTPAAASETTEEDRTAIRLNAESYTGRLDQHRAVRRVE